MCRAAELHWKNTWLANFMLITYSISILEIGENREKAFWNTSYHLSQFRFLNWDKKEKGKKNILMNFFWFLEFSLMQTFWQTKTQTSKCIWSLKSRTRVGKFLKFLNKFSHFSNLFDVFSHAQNKRKFHFIPPECLSDDFPRVLVSIWPWYFWKARRKVWY